MIKEYKNLKAFQVGNFILGLIFIPIYLFGYISLESIVVLIYSTIFIHFCLWFDLNEKSAEKKRKLLIYVPLMVFLWVFMLYVIFFW